MKTAVVSRALSVRNKRAHEIMGRNFFGVEEAIIHLRVKPTRQQLGDSVLRSRTRAIKGYSYPRSGFPALDSRDSWQSRSEALLQPRVCLV